MIFKVFISYSTKDLTQVELLRQQLSGTPIEVFIAEHSVLPGEDLGVKITQAIAECDLFVVLWSQNAENSKWVSQEIGHAKAKQKSILPLVLNEGLELPAFISTLKYLPVHKGTEPLLQARDLIVASYNKKVQALQDHAAKKQKENEQKFWLGVGVLLLWACSK